jgi:hypothetical protein
LFVEKLVYATREDSMALRLLGVWGVAARVGSAGAAVCLVSLISLVALDAGAPSGAAAALAAPPAEYDAVKAFALSGGAAQVADLVLTRDRVRMTFTGTFYFTAPVAGKVTGAVFIGQGRLRADVPPSEFEKDNVRRLLGADVIESDFRSAVLRMTDDTFATIGRDATPGAAAPEAATRLAAEFEPRLLKETGLNLSARLTTSLLNAETPGVFFAQLDGGARGRFSVVIDPQTRVPVSTFRINGGEKGVVFAFQPPIYGSDVWMSFYTQPEYAPGAAVFPSDQHDLVDITNYQIDVDLRGVPKLMGFVARIDMTARSGGVRAIPFSLGESLPSYQDMRLKKQLRLKSVRRGDRDVAAVQEDWEGGFTIFLDTPLAAGETFSVDVTAAGEFIQGSDVIAECHYPLSNTDWLPRHGYLDRATFDLTFRHQRRHKVASVGTRVAERPDETDRDVTITRYRMEQPVAFVVFAAGPFERHARSVTWEAGGKPTPLEFNAPPRQTYQMNHQFMLDELDNTVRYFNALFGAYPYPSFGAAFHPYGFGQGFPSLLMLPPPLPAQLMKESATFAFIAHETAHQWWGNIVAWRSYRDQWLSEGFAEYSGMLYAGQRSKQDKGTLAEHIRVAREALRNPPRTTQGLGQGRLADVGPIILGHRLNTSKSFGAYQALIYSKGALVLRMLHFLLSHPTTGDEKPFLAMMTDFVERYRNRAASTEDFMRIAGQHFARSPLAQRYGFADLSWFFRQWVYESGLPSYTLEYQLAPNPDGSVMLTGVIRQENVPAGWEMPLPVVFTFAGNQQGRATVRAQGAEAKVEIKLPAKPAKVELDPMSWILSERTVTRAR